MSSAATVKAVLTLSTSSKVFSRLPTSWPANQKASAYMPDRKEGKEGGMHESAFRQCSLDAENWLHSTTH